MYMLLASAQACDKLRQCITSPARVGIPHRQGARSVGCFAHSRLDTGGPRSVSCDSS